MYNTKQNTREIGPAEVDEKVKMQKENLRSVSNIELGSNVAANGRPSFELGILDLGSRGSREHSLSRNLSPVAGWRRCRHLAWDNSKAEQPGRTIELTVNYH